MSYLNKIFNFLKDKKYFVGVITIVLVLFGVFIFRNKSTQTDTFVVNHSDFVNQVSVSGKVIAAEDVQLSFKNGGRIERIYFPVGSGIVKAGSLIAKIDAKDAEKALHDAEINLASAKLDLEKIKLQNSNINLNADLQKAYDDGFTSVSDAFLDFPTVITGLEDLLTDNLLSENTARNNGSIALDYRIQAETLYYNAKDTFAKNRINFRKIDRNSPKVEIENIINETYETTKVLVDAIKSTRNLVDYLSDETGRNTEYSSFQTTLSSYANTANEHLSSLLSIKTSIKGFKDAFSDTDLEIEDSLLSIKQKENTLQDAKNRLSDYYIRAPFDGIITKIDAKVGEIATPNVPLVEMMSAETFQIESYVPEVNIAQIKLGNEAQITLDAYGESATFTATVISIDPAETIRDGVSTYKIKLKFNNNDDRIKSGMTANVSIVTFIKQNVIAIPGRVIFEKNGKNFVQVKADEKVTDREVILGAISSLGKTEIVSGLSDGEEVLLNPITK
ncbi:efflux RND transporter periplasmic adaptor subunit [Candidatus Nomurabacteria bacterium]|nr:efflux RND transporter periplasmic adaptor subunit [Candidatus Nomurabacteria bacterium]